MVKVVFSKSSNSKKKMTAIFYKDGKKIKTTHFGAKGYDDYTKTKDKKQRTRYINRHTNSSENHSDYKSAGTQPEFWHLGLDMVASMIDELESLS